MGKRAWMRLGCLILIAALLIPVSIAPVKAREIRWVEVKAYAAGREISGTLTLMQVDGELCIYSEDARVLSGADQYIYNADKGHIFTFGAHRVYPDVIAYRYDTRVFFPLKELMDALNTRYFYDEESYQIVFIPCMSFAENLKNDCMEIFCSNLYDVENMEDTLGVALSAVFNILGGLRIDVLWGGYQREHFEEVVAGVMFNDDYSDVLEFMSDADKMLGDLATMVDFNKTDLDGIKHACTLFSVDYDGFLEAYDTVSEGPDSLQGIGLGSVLEVAQRVEAAQNANEVYVNAVRIGLQQNPSVDGILERAVDEVCAYYDDCRPTFVAIIGDLSSTVLLETADEAADAFAKNVLREVILLEGLRDGKLYKLNINELYVKAAKLVMDSLGLDEMTKAAEQTAVCRYMQEFASESFHDGMDNSNRVTDPLRVKYSTILYLRLAEYAWSLYEFDSKVGNMAQENAKVCREAIKTLTAYDDEELVMTVDNERLDALGMSVNMQEVSPAESSTAQPQETADAFASAQPTAAPTQRPPKEFLFSDSAIADGEYRIQIHLFSEEVTDTANGWMVRADVYEKLGVTQEVVDELKIGDLIGGYTVSKLEDEGFGMKRKLWIADGYYLMKESDDIWYLHMRENDLYVLKESRDRPIEILRGKTELYDDFTWLAYGQGSSMQKVTYLSDFYNTPYYRDGGQRPLELTLTVENGYVTKAVWEYRP